MNTTQFTRTLKKYKPFVVKKNAEKGLEPFIYIDECYEKGYKDISNILIYDTHFYIAEYIENNKIKYELILGNEYWLDEDLEKLEKILYDYVKDHIGFSIAI